MLRTIVVTCNTVFIYGFTDNLKLNKSLTIDIDPIMKTMRVQVNRQKKKDGDIAVWFNSLILV